MSDLEDDLLNSELDNVEQPAQPVINRSVIRKSAAAKPRAGATKTAAAKKVPASKTAAAAATATVKTKARRGALKDRTNVGNGSGTEEVDDFDENAGAETGAAPAKAARDSIKKSKTTTSSKTQTKQKQQDAENDNDNDDNDQAEVALVKKVAHRSTKPKISAATATATAAPTTARDEIPDSQAPARGGAARKPKVANRAPSPPPPPPPPRIESVPETQADAEAGHVSQSIEEDEDDDDAMQVDDNDDKQQAPPPSNPVHRQQDRARSISRQRPTLPQPHPQPQSHPAAHARARSTSIQPRSFSRNRAGSASDTERRLADSDVRRKLSDVTRKYDDMRIKYDSLTELVQNAADSNFDKLKKASDERAKGIAYLFLKFSSPLASPRLLADNNPSPIDANNLISSLKREISELRKASSNTTSESARLKSEVAQLTTTNEKAVEEAKASAVALLEAQNEVKSLTARLDAARKANQVPIVEKPPVSAVKGGPRGHIGGSGPEATREAKMKEELYRDLTGLIINSVKQKDGEDEYSCIQTGRNGSKFPIKSSTSPQPPLDFADLFAALHFHLTVNNDSTVSNPKTPSGLSYEDTEFGYEPLLDENRDRDLIDILPDYLTEDICFPRNHAIKFYTKIVGSMTKNIVFEDGDES